MGRNKRIEPDAEITDLILSGCALVAGVVFVHQINWFLSYLYIVLLCLIIFDYD